MACRRTVLCLLTGLLISSCTPRRGSYYRIRKGDTLYRISKNYDVDVETLMNLNEIENPQDLKVGSSIYIPMVAGRESPYTGRAKHVYKPDVPKSHAYTSVKGNYIWPVKGRILTEFSQDPKRRYDGINIEGKYGSDVKAMGNGEVLYSGSDVKGYGNMIIVKHTDKLYSIYALNCENLVSKGDHVKKSQVIAKLGGIPRIGKSFLHFQIRSGKKPLNPLEILDK